MPGLLNAVFRHKVPAQIQRRGKAFAHQSGKYNNLTEVGDREGNFLRLWKHKSISGENKFELSGKIKVVQNRSFEHTAL